MGNSIYNSIPNLNNFGNFVSQFNQFRSMFSGNPQTRVQQLIQSGQMSQEQFNQLATQATQLRQLFK